MTLSRFAANVLLVPLGALAIALASASLMHCASEEPAPLAPLFDNPSEAGTGGDAGAPDGDAILPFEAVPPHVYVSKVKNLLTGMPVTDEEIQAVTDEPAVLKQLVDVWASTPNGQRKLLEFFTLAFQQTQIANGDFADIFGNDDSLPGGAAMLANVTESFARTALAMVGQGRSLTDAVTTREVMATPALLSVLALIDMRHIDDDAKVSDKWFDRTSKLNGFTVQNTRPIPYAQSVDPTNADYMNFYTASDLGAGCSARVYPPGRENSMRLAASLMGTVPGVGAAGTPCNNQKAITPILPPEDFSTWKMVTIRKPAAGEKVLDFWELPKLRAASEIALEVPRVGFFSTPAYQANYRTNSSNQARVTVNQSLIVALGLSFESETSIVPLSETGLDAEHADPTTPCYGCHKLLDPMRPYFRKNLTLAYHEQRDPKQIASVAAFTFGSVQAQGGTLDDFAQAIITHPYFANAWVQKLCFFADSIGCSEGDPEFQRVVVAFRDSKFDFRVLLREIMASPLVTGAAPSKTFQDREVLVTISRYDHLCRALQNRLGVDACNLNKNAQQISVNIPRDAYGRGAESPVLTSDVSLFFRTSAENLCREVAAAVVEGPQSRYSSKAAGTAMADFVSTVMGLPNIDPRAAAARAIVESHYTAALATGAKPVDALRSTFVLACTAPSAISIGL